MRFRLRTLMIVVFIAALVCLAMRSPSIWWSGGLSLALIFAILTSVVLAIYRSGEIRAWAIGFCLFSFAFLLIQGNLAFDTVSSVSQPTKAIIRWSFVRLHPVDSRNLVAADDPFGPSAPPTFYPYENICITTLAAIFGWIGATMTQWLDRSRLLRPAN
jgi:hypothetical protein